MNKIHINLNKQVNESYDIIFNSDPWATISDFISSWKILIVTDENVAPLYLESFQSSLPKNHIKKTIILGAGENYKNISSVTQICEKLDENNFSRKDYIIVLWGGVIWDTAGFASSIYKRWINFIQVPTTLLSMFDSSVWWKTWINFMSQKNILWNFKQPILVVISPTYINTLPKLEVLSWLFEWLKHSLIDNQNHFLSYRKKYQYLLESPIDKEKCEQIIYDSIRVKSKIVEKDEKETHQRKFLNYGHTFGHAIESLSDYKIPHWICIAFGMLYVNILSKELGFLSSNKSKEINTFIFQVLSPYKNLFPSQIIQSLDFGEIYLKMLQDKKNDSDKISFVLLEDIWAPFISPLNDRNLLETVFKDIKKDITLFLK